MISSSPDSGHYVLSLEIMNRASSRLSTNIFRYLLALISVTVALAIRLALNKYLGLYHPYVTLYPAIAFSAWYCGLWESLTASVAAMLVANYLWVAPQYSLSIRSVAELVGIITYLSVVA